MRHITSTESRFAVADSACAEQSALHMTRAAIARWSGSPVPAGALTRELPRVSPQARWLAEAHNGLADWIARGGFAQADDAAPGLAPLAKPVMYQLAPHTPAVTSSANACID
jgi:hypothetical protein